MDDVSLEDVEQTLEPSRRSLLATTAATLTGLAGCGDDLQEAAEKGDRENPKVQPGETPAEDEKEELREIANTQTNTPTQSTSTNQLSTDAGKTNQLYEYSSIRIPDFDIKRHDPPMEGLAEWFIAENPQDIDYLGLDLPDGIETKVESIMNAGYFSFDILKLSDEAAAEEFVGEYTSVKEIYGNPVYIFDHDTDRIMQSGDTLYITYGLEWIKPDEMLRKGYKAQNGEFPSKSGKYPSVKAARQRFEGDAVILQNGEPDNTVKLTCANLNEEGETEPFKKLLFGQEGDLLRTY